MSDSEVGDSCLFIPRSHNRSQYVLGNKIFCVASGATGGDSDVCSVLLDIELATN